MAARETGRATSDDHAGGAGSGGRAGSAVGGEFAITGTLPTLADVVAFKRGTAALDYGYYRFVQHPHLRRLEALLKDAYRSRHCRLAESREVALLELLLVLWKPAARRRVIVVRQEGSTIPRLDPSFLPPYYRDALPITDPGTSAAATAGIEAGDIVILCPSADGAPAGALDEIERAAREGGATTIELADYRAGGPVRVPAAQYHVIGIGAGRAEAGAAGGAVLGNPDRIMDRLAVETRRRGAVLSSRAAAQIVAGLVTGDVPGAGTGAPRRVARAVCRMEGGNEAFLYASGMSAITRLLDTLRTPGRSQVVAVGHLFNDTYESLRVAPRASGEEPNRFLGVDELSQLEGFLGAQTAAILTETITNPLGDVPDLELLSRAAHARGIPLIVDNTLATPLNCRPFEHGADFVIHSTTKFLNGANDHGGGVVIAKDAAGAALLAQCRAHWQDAMSDAEAAALEARLHTFPARMKRYNQNAALAAAALAADPAVGRIYFNGSPTHRSHATARRLLDGTGSVMSFTLADESMDALRRFYDSPLAGILKAPSLGSDMTLLCPYAMLTHLDDSDEELAAIGLPRSLLRLAVGCEEDITPVLASLRAALGSVRKG